MNKYLDQANAIMFQLVQDRRYLHANPEVGFDLPKTTEYVLKRLTEMGYIPKKLGKSGVVATIGKGNKTLLLRADMDALPSIETTDLPYKSRSKQLTR